jgi:hypothetical protein
MEDALLVYVLDGSEQLVHIALDLLRCERRLLILEALVQVLLH